MKNMKNMKNLLVTMVHYLQIISNITLLMFPFIKRILIKIIKKTSFISSFFGIFFGGIYPKNILYKTMVMVLPLSVSTFESDSDSEFDDTEMDINNSTLNDIDYDSEATVGSNDSNGSNGSNISNNSKDSNESNDYNEYTHYLNVNGGSSDSENNGSETNDSETNELAKSVLGYYDIRNYLYDNIYPYGLDNERSFIVKHMIETSRDEIASWCTELKVVNSHLTSDLYESLLVRTIRDKIENFDWTNHSEALESYVETQHPLLPQVPSGLLKSIGETEHSFLPKISSELLLISESSTEPFFNVSLIISIIIFIITIIRYFIYLYEYKLNEILQNIKKYLTVGIYSIKNSLNLVFKCSSLKSIINNLTPTLFQQIQVILYILILTVLIPHLYVAIWYLITYVDLERMILLISTLLLLDLYFLEEICDIIIYYIFTIIDEILNYFNIDDNSISNLSSLPLILNIISNSSDRIIGENSPDYNSDTDRDLSEYDNDSIRDTLVGVDSNDGNNTDDSLEGYIDVNNRVNWEEFRDLLDQDELDLNDILNNWTEDEISDLFFYYNEIADLSDNSDRDSDIDMDAYSDGDIDMGYYINSNSDSDSDSSDEYIYTHFDHNYSYNYILPNTNNDNNTDIDSDSDSVIGYEIGEINSAITTDNIGNSLISLDDMSTLSFVYSMFTIAKTIISINILITLTIIVKYLIIQFLLILGLLLILLLINRNNLNLPKIEFISLLVSLKICNYFIKRIKLIVKLLSKDKDIENIKYLDKIINDNNYLDSSINNSVNMFSSLISKIKDFTNNIITNINETVNNSHYVFNTPTPKNYETITITNSTNYLDTNSENIITSLLGWFKDIVNVGSFVNIGPQPKVVTVVNPQEEVIIKINRSVEPAINNCGSILESLYKFFNEIIINSLINPFKDIFWLDIITIINNIINTNIFTKILSILITLFILQIILIIGLSTKNINKLNLLFNNIVKLIINKIYLLIVFIPCIFIIICVLYSLESIIYTNIIDIIFVALVFKFTRFNFDKLDINTSKQININIKSYINKIIQLIKNYILYIFTLCVSFIALFNNSLYLLMVTPFSIISESDNSSTLIGESISENKYKISDSLQNTNRWTISEDINPNKIPLHSALPEANVSEREATTAYLRRTYGIRFNETMSKQAFNGDDIFGSEYGFSNNSNSIFSKIKNSVINLFSKSKKTDSYISLSPIKDREHSPIAQEISSSPLIDFSKIKNSIIKFITNKKENSNESSFLNLSSSGKKEVTNNYFKSIEASFKEEQRLKESNESFCNKDASLDDINNLEYYNEVFQSTFRVPSIYEFSMFTLVFDFIDDWKYLYILIIIWYLFKLIIILKNIIKKIKSTIIPYFKCLLVAIPVSIINDREGKNKNLNSFLNFDDSDSDKSNDDINNINSKVNHNQDNSLNIVVNNWLNHIHEENIVNYFKELPSLPLFKQLPPIPKVDYEELVASNLINTKPLPELPKILPDLPKKDILLYLDPLNVGIELEAPLPDLPKSETLIDPLNSLKKFYEENLIEEDKYFILSVNESSCGISLSWLDSLILFLSYLSTEQLKFIYLFFLLIFLLVRNWKSIKTINYNNIFKLTNLKFILSCIPIILVFIKLIYLFDISWYYMILKYISSNMNYFINIDNKVLFISSMFYISLSKILLKYLNLIGKKIKIYLTSHFILPLNLSVLGFSIKQNNNLLNNNDNNSNLDSYISINSEYISNMETNVSNSESEASIGSIGSIGTIIKQEEVWVNVPSNSQLNCDNENSLPSILDGDVELEKLGKISKSNFIKSWLKTNYYTEDNNINNPEIFDFGSDSEPKLFNSELELNDSNTFNNIDETIDSYQSKTYSLVSQFNDTLQDAVTNLGDYGKILQILF
jgi:hypothetical protein